MRGKYLAFFWQFFSKVSTRVYEKVLFISQFTWIVHNVLTSYIFINDQVLIYPSLHYPYTEFVLLLVLRTATVWLVVLTNTKHISRLITKDNIPGTRPLCSKAPVILILGMIDSYYFHFVFNRVDVYSRSSVTERSFIWNDYIIWDVKSPPHSVNNLPRKNFSSLAREQYSRRLRIKFVILQFSVVFKIVTTPRELRESFPRPERFFCLARQ